MANIEVFNFEKDFNEKLKSITTENSYSIIIDENHYNDLIKKVLETQKKTSEKNGSDYRRLKRYGILTIGDVQKLIVPNKTDILYHAHNGEFFSILKEAHVETGHGGLHKMNEYLQRKYANLNRKAILLFLGFCETCQKKKAFPKKGVVVKPLLFNEVTARAQVDLIDMQSCQDRGYKFILNYQEHLTKFLVLSPLKSKTAAEVAYNLLDIFCGYGCCSVLQSDNGREFVNSIINELSILWPTLKIVHGKPRNSESQGSVERANRDVGDMIRSWMLDNKTTKWAEGLRFVQYQKNNSLHSGIKQSPFRAMFVRDAKIGLKDSILPEFILENLVNEEDAEAAINSELGTPDVNDVETLKRIQDNIEKNSSKAYKGL